MDTNSNQTTVRTQLPPLTKEQIEGFKPMNDELVAEINEFVMGEIWANGVVREKSLNEILDLDQNSDYYSVYNVPDSVSPWNKDENTPYSLFEIAEKTRANLGMRQRIANQLKKQEDVPYLGCPTFHLPGDKVLQNARIISTKSGIFTFAGRLAHSLKKGKAGLVILPRKKAQNADELKEDSTVSKDAKAKTEEKAKAKVIGM